MFAIVPSIASKAIYLVSSLVDQVDVGIHNYQKGISHDQAFQWVDSQPYFHKEGVCIVYSSKSSILMIINDLIDYTMNLPLEELRGDLKAINLMMVKNLNWIPTASID